jgi:hypothetical protein
MYLIRKVISSWTTSITQRNVQNTTPSHYHETAADSSTCGHIKLKLNSVACSPQANYTDRAAAACWRS